MTPQITIESRDGSRNGEAKELSNRLGLPLRENVGRVSDGELRLVMFDDRTEIWDHHCVRRGTRVDFFGIDVRTGSGNLSNRQPLARAMGGRGLTIIDATAGFGRDAFLLACMGHQILAIERSPVIHLLLRESMRTASRDNTISEALGNRLQVTCEDSTTLLTNLEERPDVVYIDPMFDQESHSSALPRKRAQLLRSIVGADQDAGELFETARAVAQNRVVVKRSDDARILAPNPDVQIKGKIVRYDIYLSQ